MTILHVHHDDGEVDTRSCDKETIIHVRLPLLARGEMVSVAVNVTSGILSLLAIEECMPVVMAQAEVSPLEACLIAPLLHHVNQQCTFDLLLASTTNDGCTTEAAVLAARFEIQNARAHKRMNELVGHIHKAMHTMQPKLRRFLGVPIDIFSIRETGYLLALLTKADEKPAETFQAREA